MIRYTRLDNKDVCKTYKWQDHCQDRHKEVQKDEWTEVEEWKLFQDR